MRICCILWFYFAYSFILMKYDLLKGFLLKDYFDIHFHSSRNKEKALFFRKFLGFLSFQYI